MSIEGQLTQDLKAAMLAGQQHRVLTLRGLKSNLLYAKVAKNGPRDEELSDDEVLDILAREAKKRQESADLYTKGGNAEKAKAELEEKTMIETYLPKQLGEDELKEIIESVVGELGADSMSQMGAVIGKVKQKVGVSADGAAVARLVKERLGG
jgi:uncharacterized protein YqeY